MRGHLELMDQEDPKDRRETLRLVFDELDRMGRMVADVLTLAKSVRPDFVRPAPVDVEDLCRQLLEKFQALGKRRWMLEATTGGSVLADRQRLTQAMIQLAQNAVQHTNEDDVITLRAGRTDHEFRLAVRDLGPGIAPEDLERIFVRIARGGGSRRSDGAGLGLSIVNAIAEAHGGRVEVESRPGEGAEFTLVLPAAPGSPSMANASTLRPHLSGVS